MNKDVLYLNGHTIAYNDIKSGAFSWKTDFERTTLEFCRQWLNGQQTFSLQTSGSTGQPKTIVVSRQQMVVSAAGTIKYFKLKPGDTALVCLSTAYIAGKMMLVRAFECGMKIIAIEPVGNPLAGITAAVDFMAVVPLQIDSILEDSATLTKLGTIKATLVGGAPVTIALEQKLAACGAPVYATFGMTETLSHIAIRQMAPQQESIFTVLPNIIISQDARGCLTITGPVTNHKVVITNDTVDLINENQFNWLGRVDRVINSGGIKIQVEQLERKIEKVMLDLNMNNRFFVYGEKDNQLGEKAVLLVEGIPSENDALVAGLNEHLTKYEVPKLIRYYPNFIETRTGKIDRKLMRRLIPNRK
jgi:O-succinylbenzoic acid--CoA ligase